MDPATLRARVERLSDAQRALLARRLEADDAPGSAPTPGLAGTGPRLVAYWTGTREGHDPCAAVRAYLRERLPEHMVPERVVHLERLPRTATGKLDRRRLPAPADLAPPEAEPHEAPAAGLETTIAALWARALGVPEVGPEDHFFELGGHSLLGVALMGELETELGFEIGLGALFDAPRLRDFVALVGRRRSPAVRHLVPIVGEGSGAPLFCIHWGSHEVRDVDRPVYGLFHQLDPADPSDGTIDDIADKYLGDVRAIQPAGPYHLAGCSAGGIIALEIARRLIADGEAVALVGLVDPTPRIDVWRLRYRILRQLSLLLGQAGPAAKLRHLAREIPAMVARRIAPRRRASTPVEEIPQAPTGSNEPLDANLIADVNEEQYIRIALAHAVQPIAVPAVLFLPGQTRLIRRELDDSWREVLPDLRDVHFVEGAETHLDLFRPGPVRWVLDRL